MLRSLRNREPTNTNSTINPCHTPSKNPAGFVGSLIALYGFAPGAQPATILKTTRATKRNATADLMAVPPLLTITQNAHQKSHGDIGLRECALKFASS